MSAIDEFLKIEKAGKEEKTASAWGAFLGKAPTAAPPNRALQALQGLGGSVGTSAVHALGGALGLGAVTGIGMAASGIIDAATKSRDYKEMLKMNPNVQAFHDENPHLSNTFFSSMRSINPEFSKNPMIAGHLMGNMIDSHQSGNGAGQVLMSLMDTTSKMKMTDPLHEALGVGASEGLKASLKAQVAEQYAPPEKKMPLPGGGGSFRSQERPQDPNAALKAMAEKMRLEEEIRNRSPQAPHSYYPGGPPSFRDELQKIAYGVEDAQKVMNVAKPKIVHVPDVTHMSVKLTPNQMRQRAVNKVNDISYLTQQPSFQRAKQEGLKYPEFFEGQIPIMRNSAQAPIEKHPLQGKILSPGGADALSSLEKEQALTPDFRQRISNLSPDARSHMNSIMYGHEMDELGVKKLGPSAHPYGHADWSVIMREHNRTVTSPENIRNQIAPVMKDYRSAGNAFVDGSQKGNLPVREADVLKRDAGVTYGEGPRYSRHAIKRISESMERERLATMAKEQDKLLKKETINHYMSPMVKRDQNAYYDYKDMLQDATAPFEAR